MKKSCRVLFTVFLAAGLIFGYGLPVIAGPTQLVPRVSIREEYNDNILFSKNNKKNDLISIASGGIRVQKRTERLTSNADITVKQSLYKDYHELNALDKAISMSLDYRLSERLTLGASGGWKADSLRGYDEDTTGLALNGDRESLNASLSGGYLISEISRINLSMDMEKTDIERTIQKEDTKENQFRLEYSHNLSRIWNNTTGLLGLSYMQYTSEIKSLDAFDSFQEYDSDIWQFTIGYSQDITELLSYYVQTGISYTDTKETLTQNTSFGPASRLSHADSLGNVFIAGITYKELYYDVALSLSHDVRGGSGTNGAVERTSASFDFTGRLTDVFQATLNASCYLNQNDRNTSDDLDELTLSIQPGFRYNISDDASLTAGYRFIRREDRQSNTFTEGSLVYFEVTKQFKYDID